MVLCTVVVGAELLVGAVVDERAVLVSMVLVFVFELLLVVDGAAASGVGSAAPFKKNATSAIPTTTSVIAPEISDFILRVECGLFKSSKLEMPFAMMRGYFSNQLGLPFLWESKTRSLAKLAPFP